MVNGWVPTSLGDILTQERRPVALDPEKKYAEIGVYSYGRGIFHKEPRTGFEIGNKDLYEIKQGDFIFQITFAWEGAIALASETEDGMYGSVRFPTYRINEDICYPKFLLNYFKTEEGRREIGRISPGSAGRNRVLATKRLPEIFVPLPPLAEQRRIMAHIESLAARVNEAQRLREDADEEINSLLISMAHRSDESKNKLLAEGWAEVRLGEVIQQVKDRCRVEPNIEYPNLGIYSFARGLFRKQPIDGNLTSAKELYRVHKGQFIYSRLFAFEGACGFITDEYDSCYVSGEYPTFDCDPERVKPEFLFSYFKSLDTWKEISAGSKGLGDRRQRVQPDKFLEHKFLLPPLEWQFKIAMVIQKVEVLRGLQSETEKALNALLPSILDRAFKGKLI